MNATALRDAPSTSVLVVRPSSLGDVVHALPVVADIARHLPGAAIDWIAEETFAPLVRLHPGIRHVFPIALRRWRGQLLRRAAWREFAAFRDALGHCRYGAVLDLQEQIKGALVARIAHGERHGFDRDSIREPVSTWLHERHHAVALDLHFEQRCRALAAAALGYRAEGAPVYGLLAPAAPDGMLPEAPYVVAVHATSRTSKLWPIAHWQRVIEGFERRGLLVLLPWGNDDERARSEELAQTHRNALVPAFRPLPLVAALLDRAQLVIGVDTGLVHLAAALGTPAIALFTRTDPALAGVAIAGPHAVDLGGRDAIPSPEEVLGTAAALVGARSTHDPRAV